MADCTHTHEPHLAGDAEFPEMELARMAVSMETQSRHLTRAVAQLLQSLHLHWSQAVSAHESSRCSSHNRLIRPPSYSAVQAFCKNLQLPTVLNGSRDLHPVPFRQSSQGPRGSLLNFPLSPLPLVLTNPPCHQHFFSQHWLSKMAPLGHNIMTVTHSTRDNG